MNDLFSDLPSDATAWAKQKIDSGICPRRVAYEMLGTCLALLLRTRHSDAQIRGLVEHVLTHHQAHEKKQVLN